MSGTAAGTDGGHAPADGHDPDWELVRRAQRSDAMAFEQLVLLHELAIFRYAYRFLGDSEEAREMTQDTFLQAHRHLAGFRGETKFRNWLHGIAKNLCLNRIGYWKRRARSKHDSLNAQDEGQASRHDRELSDPRPDALEHLSSLEFQRVVHEEMRRVEGEYRAVLVLRDMEGRSYEEIAQVLKVPVGTVKSRLNRGRAELLSRLRRRFGASLSG